MGYLSLENLDMGLDLNRFLLNILKEGFIGVRACLEIGIDLVSNLQQMPERTSLPLEPLPSLLY
jgi:hypothetical protein